MRILTAIRNAVALTALSATAFVNTPPAAARADAATITDPQLLVAIEQATAHHTEATAGTLPVEILTTNADAVAAGVASLGGTVTGRVANSLVQADMPVGQLRALANVPGASFVRAARKIGYVPEAAHTRTELLTPVVDLTNATPWHNAGITGAGVKVGVVDWFNMNAWNTVENGPTPTLANGHVFCKDSAGFDICNGADIKSWAGDVHGLAVVEALKDTAPGAEVYVAEVATLSDLQSAIDWFAANHVTIMSRSLESSFDGPGDGTGPSADVVDYAAARGINWFNSVGNNGNSKYLKVTVPTTLSATGYVDFDTSSGVDTWMRMDGSHLWFNGVRWNDWAANRTDYSVEFWAPKLGTGNALSLWHNNPTTAQVVGLAAFNDAQYYYGPSKVDNNQIGGAPSLEATDMFVGTPNYYGFDFDSNGQGDGMIYMRIRKNAATPVGAAPDVLEVELAFGQLERYSHDGSAAKAFADSKNPFLTAVGDGYLETFMDSAIIPDSTSQGPTTDGRMKPDLYAPAPATSVALGKPFDGSDAATPAAAGVAALLQGAGLATPGEGTSALLRHFSTHDLHHLSLPNDPRESIVLLPAPPTSAAPATAGRYVPLALPVRGLDTRPRGQADPPQLIGPYSPQSIVDFNVLGMPAVPDEGVSAVAVNITSVAPVTTGYVQAYPYLRARNGATSTINLSTAGVNRPNFAIVPIGQDGKVSLYLQAGGNVIIDVLGYFLDGQPTTVSDGRFIPLASPERWVDTRGLGGAPLPASFAGTPRLANAGETIEVPTPAAVDTSVPAADVEALVVNVTSAGSQAVGYLQLIPTGATGALHSNVNYAPGSASANTAIVPLGTGGTISVSTAQATNIIVDVVGYITKDTVAADSLGMFMPITPGRAVNTRVPTANPFAGNESRTYTLTGLSAPAPIVPAGAAGVSANLTVVGPTANGYLTVYPGTQPATSNLNFAAGRTVANAALLALSPTGTVTATMSQPGNLLIDINGYFLPATASS